MAQKKNPATAKAKSAVPKEEIKEMPVIEKPLEEKQPVPEKVKATNPKELSPIEKWDIVKELLMQKFPIFQPGELDLINCTVEDRKVHIRNKLKMTDEKIAEVIPGY